MIITAFYYLDYPDSTAPDPTRATTAMYVEVGNEGDTIDSFQFTYSFTVFTFR